jgi:plastocyanin
MLSPFPLRAGLAALALSAASCSTDPVDPFVPPVPTFTVTLESGAEQAGRAEQPLPAPVQVRVRRDGVPVAGIPVMWHTLDGSLAPSGVTDAEGLAAAAWTLPPRGGRMRASARIEQIAEPVVFYAESGLPRILKVAGDKQTAVAGNALPQPLQVQVTWDGEPLAGEEVRWSFHPTPVLTGPDGIASITWSVGGAAGEQQSSAMVGRLRNPIVYFSATVTPGPVASLEMLRVPGDLRYWTHGSLIRFFLIARDAFGNTVRDAPITWSLAAGTGGHAGTSTGEGGMAYVDVTPAADYFGDIRVRAAANAAEAISDPARHAHFIFADLTGWGDEAFPSSITVRSGTTVRWAHLGWWEHRVGPKGSIPNFILSQYGGVVERPFTIPGVVEWVCAEHEWESFTIVVEP